jgi:hypothetical protein
MIVATNQQNPIRQALRKLSRTELERVVLDIHDVLFLDVDDSRPPAEKFIINPDKEFDSETIEFITDVFHNRGLSPDETYADVAEEDVPDRQESNVALG